MLKCQSSASHPRSSRVINILTPVVKVVRHLASDIITLQRGGKSHESTTHRWVTLKVNLDVCMNIDITWRQQGLYKILLREVFQTLPLPPENLSWPETFQPLVIYQVLELNPAAQCASVFLPGTGRNGSLITSSIPGNQWIESVWGQSGASQLLSVPDRAAV